MSNSLSIVKATGGFLCALLFSLSIFGQSDNLRNDLKNSFYKFNLIQLDQQLNSQKSASQRSLNISIDNQNFELNLTPRDLRAPNYRAENTSRDGTEILTREKVTTFKGTVVGQSDSRVRLTIEGDKIEGYFLTDRNQRFYIEAAQNYSRFADQKDLIVYQESDLRRTADFVCESELGAKIERGKEMFAAKSFQIMPTYLVVEIATEADFSFVTELGGAANANNEILSILNLIEGEYETKLGLTFDVVFQHAWTTPDPFDASTASLFLNSFRTYWNTNYPLSVVPRDVAHLFTSKQNFTGLGLGYLGTVCRSPTSAYSFTGRLDAGLIKYILTAHEIGHNFNATHADTVAGCENSIMATLMSNQMPLNFCQFSRTEIINFVSANNSCLTPRDSTSVRTQFDFDGDSKADVSVYRPSSGTWYLNRSNLGFTGIQFGVSTDKVVPADFDGDGKTDSAVFRNGTWYLNRSQLGFTGVSFGEATDIPVPADYDGDSKADLAVFRPSTGVWYIQRSQLGFTGIQFGQTGDKPIAADYDGDSKADVVVFRNGTWFINRSSLGFTGISFGEASDIPTPADFDGDNKADVAVFRPSTGTWYLNRSQLGFTGVQFGAAGDLPVAADYDGDGKADVSVFRNGTWYLNRSQAGFTGISFGTATDKPIPNAFIP